MSVSLWILTFVGIYLGIGVVVALVTMYMDGRNSGKTENQYRQAAFEAGRLHSDYDPWAVVVFWPIHVLQTWVPQPFKFLNGSFQWATKLGYRAQRRSIRRKRIRNARRDFKALCRKEGWPFRAKWREHKKTVAA